MNIRDEIREAIRNYSYENTTDGVLAQVVEALSFDGVEARLKEDARGVSVILAARGQEEPAYSILHVPRTTKHRGNADELRREALDIVKRNLHVWMLVHNAGAQQPVTAKHELVQRIRTLRGCAEQTAGIMVSEGFAGWDISLCVRPPTDAKWFQKAVRSAARIRAIDLIIREAGETTWVMTAAFAAGRPARDDVIALFHLFAESVPHHHHYTVHAVGIDYYAVVWAEPAA
jgi:hypothetical protein